MISKCMRLYLSLSRSPSVFFVKPIVKGKKCVNLLSEYPIRYRIEANTQKRSATGMSWTRKIRTSVTVIFNFTKC